jgi:membrane-associated phospholipid phosphatase
MLHFALPLATGSTGRTGTPSSRASSQAPSTRWRRHSVSRGDYIYTYTFYGVSPNGFAAWPSLHVAYPFLTFLVLRRAFGRIGWLAFAYTVLVAFSVMYTGDHWIIDCIGDMAFTYISFYAVIHARVAQRWLARRRLRLSV